MLRRYCLLLLLIATLLPLTGCLRFSLETLHEQTLEGTDFQMYLAREYMKLAEKEALAYDWPDAELFAQKGLKAARGETVMPEDPETWGIADSMRSPLQEALRQIRHIVTDERKQQEPEASAQAYAYFDCWVEELEENWQTEHIAACRNAFFETLNYLSIEDPVERDVVENTSTTEEATQTTPETMEIISVPAKTKDVSAHIPTNNASTHTDSAKETSATETSPASDATDTRMSEAIPAPAFLKQEITSTNAQKETTSGTSPAMDEAAAANTTAHSSLTNGRTPLRYEVYFDANSTELTQSARNMLDQVIAAYHDSERSLTLNGYSAREGDESYAMTLSKLRAQEVRKYLERKGISPDRIMLFAFGEEQDQVEAPVTEKNRRVQILVE
ncbi:MAG: OmpA family protein [Hyphomicrobiales bacterium]|nr:OmpA family protein [Hyphomicrobiales bacterium]